MAREQAQMLRGMLGSTPGPIELDRLEAGIEKGASAEELGEHMFELLITVTLDFKADPETKSIEAVDSPGATLEASSDLQAKMQYLYTYGVRMMTTGLLDVDKLKDIILTKIAARVSMTGEQLDEWLEV